MIENMYRTTRESCLFLMVLLIYQMIQPMVGLKNMMQHNRGSPHSIQFDAGPSADKRAPSVSSSVHHNFAEQSKEVFGDQLEANYDEYPMVVPKRAALLLDRLMVALYHALEKEQSDRERLSQIYNKNNLKNIQTGGKDRLKEYHKGPNSQDEKDSPFLAMYSDGDSSIMMDYDFKNLNSINHATGETLMARSFQRRANMGLDFDNEMGVERVSSLIDTSSPLSRDLISGYTSGESGVGVGGRRTASSYWRCYFNAVSCF